MEIAQINGFIIFRELEEYYKFPEITTLSVIVKPIEKKLDVLNGYNFARETNFEIDIYGNMVEMNNISSGIPLNKFKNIVENLEKLDILYTDKIRCYLNKKGLSVWSNKFKYWDGEEDIINKKIQSVLTKSDITPYDWDMNMTSLSKVYFGFK